jgi:hypothetical protein
MLSSYMRVRGYTSALFMLALVVSPCYGDTETFIGKKLDGTMDDWDKCQVVSMQTSNDTYYTECRSDLEKCTGEYIRQQGNDTGVSYCLGNRLAAAKGEESKTPAWVLPVSIVGFALLVVAGVVIYYKCKSCRKKKVEYTEGEGTKANHGVQADDTSFVRYYNEDKPGQGLYVETESKSQRRKAFYTKLSKTKTESNQQNDGLVKLMEREGQYDSEVWPVEMTGRDGVVDGVYGSPIAAVVKDIDGGVLGYGVRNLEGARRRLLQDGKDHPQVDDKNTAFLVLNDHVTVPNEKIHKRFAEKISEYTGTPPLDLQLPSARHNRKMLANDTAGACGYVEITPPVTLGDNFIYAHDACETFASENIMSVAFFWDVMKFEQNGSESYDPSWLARTKNDPRLGHPADAIQHKDVLSWVHAEEQQVVAYPYRSFGNLLPYTPAMDAGYDQIYEGSKHLQIKAHLNKIARPELWDVSVGGGGDIFSRGVMTTLYEVMDRVQTVTAAAMNGDYLSYSGEFQHSTLRNPQRVCAGEKKAMEWKKGGVQGGTTDVLFKETRNYCGKSAAKSTFGIPPKKLLMDTGMHMYAGLSNVKAAIFAEFVAAPGIRTRKEWYWLSKISLDILWAQIQTLNFMWTPVTGQQREPEYPTPK